MAASLARDRRCGTRSSLLSDVPTSARRAGDESAVIGAVTAVTGAVTAVIGAVVAVTRRRDRRDRRLQGQCSKPQAAEVLARVGVEPGGLGAWSVSCARDVTRARLPCTGLPVHVN